MNEDTNQPVFRRLVLELPPQTQTRLSPADRYRSITSFAWRASHHHPPLRSVLLSCRISLFHSLITGLGFYSSQQSSSAAIVPRHKPSFLFCVHQIIHELLNVIRATECFHCQLFCSIWHTTTIWTCIAIYSWKAQVSRKQVVTKAKTAYAIPDNFALCRS